MVSNDKNKVTVDSILAKLSPEEKKVFMQAQKSVEARAKKKSVQRRLDDEDRACVQKCLEKVGCKEKKLALNDARALALRWVLTKCGNEFGQHVKDLLYGGARQKSETDKVDPPTLQPRQKVQQGTYKPPAVHVNQ